MSSYFMSSTASSSAANEGNMSRNRFMLYVLLVIKCDVLVALGRIEDPGYCRWLDALVSG
ncbi:hypothetical protein Pmar_PMAR017479 [Perkinsus marinus ATCC 50983]|uniref:Uncharacterized protein n=1 Tax=Perkinsus marinus (strain ATCC 50983 / TXsc) TaxID=423536 RepID=C5KG27_PERM5|nr:hypothetical protein Pmar_PMAR017479 [Perkinsus marinus ATCC 50983]EER16591.1 hypothetical protein Pmar_PMAR017479 [Perkinsus marinus ATCC 50983]|eukprot:XP_002784795.1 hypothetical protein Pmar_PMAR017479 [Perkinsus marinus ATCC 50983]